MGDRFYRGHNSVEKACCLTSGQAVRQEGVRILYKRRISDRDAVDAIGAETVCGVEGDLIERSRCADGSLAYRHRFRHSRLG